MEEKVEEKEKETTEEKKEEEKEKVEEKTEEKTEEKAEEKKEEGEEKEKEKKTFKLKAPKVPAFLRSKSKEREKNKVRKDNDHLQIIFGRISSKEVCQHCWKLEGAIKDFCGFIGS